MKKYLEAARFRETSEETFDQANARARRVSVRLTKTSFMMDNHAKAAMQAKQPGKKIIYLRKLADVIAPAMAGIAACRDGCSHCCNIPVLLTEGEARVIAEETGRPMTTPIEFRPESNQNYIGTPCPFLVDGRCSIYASRPFACRVHYNLDADDLLCRLIPDEQIRVPYFNQSKLQLVYVGAQLPHHEKLADIRDFFAAAGTVTPE